ncbi:uracil phosphoribosyltransferase [Lentisphaerota bacterium WC36G]|nr:uracil phosphoribosyltransferase [Lentisphaerae bacterium WC36]
MLTVVEHPCISAKLTIMRDKNTPHREFRNCAEEITKFIAYEALKNIELENVEIETPLEPMIGKKVKNEMILIPILRAGLGMTDTILDLIPTARTGFVGLYRADDHETIVEYFCKLPECNKDALAIIVDPMLATGNSLVAAIDLVKKHGFSKIIAITILSAPEGVNEITTKHPDVKLYTGALDRGLNENNYILPGLGDAGDRIFGTK